jgi:septal ring factor EnvC (AmiA/AmiB activator)
MMLYTYISGILTALIIIFTFVAVRTNRKYNELLASNEVIADGASTLYDQLEYWRDEMDNELDMIQESMDEDEYEKISTLNKELSELKATVGRQQENSNNTRDHNDKLLESLFNEISTLKRNLKTLGSDPNTISRY